MVVWFHPGYLVSRDTWYPGIPWEYRDVIVLHEIVLQLLLVVVQESVAQGVHVYSRKECFASLPPVGDGDDDSTIFAIRWMTY